MPSTPTSGNCSFLSPVCHLWFRARFQLDGVFTEVELYRFVAELFRAFDQAVYFKTRERSTGDLDRVSFGGGCYGGCGLENPTPWEVSEAFAEALGTGSPLEFEYLQETVDK